MSIIGKNIERRLSDLGMTQRELSEAAGLSQVMIHKLISGKAKKTAKLIELAKALKCNPEWLQNGHQPALPNDLTIDISHLSKRDRALIKNMIRSLEDEYKESDDSKTSH